MLDNLSAFNESSQHGPHTNLSCNSGSSSDLQSSQPDVSLVARTSAASINNNGSNYVMAEIGQVRSVMPANSEFHKENARSYDGLTPSTGK